jgi:hypothetical protein
VPRFCGVDRDIRVDEIIIYGGAVLTTSTTSFIYEFSNEKSLKTSSAKKTMVL